jgi:hypothetical protein
MNFGFNSNVRVGDVTYHVQTEDRGPAHPFLDTVVYLAGRVVYKRSTNYEKYVKGAVESRRSQWLHERLSQQHRDVIAELEAGTLAVQGQEKPQVVARGAGADASLELRLTNPQNWLAAGKVTLEIELTAKDSKKAVVDADVQACLEHEKSRVPCAESRTDANGCATLQFAMPADIAEGASLVVRAADGSRQGELRFNLKAKPSEKTPAPVS